jgi:hypothetical protein
MKEVQGLVLLKDYGRQNGGAVASLVVVFEVGDGYCGDKCLL